MKTTKDSPPLPDCEHDMAHNDHPIKICVRRKGLLRSFGKGEQADLLSFNQYGMIFCCKQHFDVNEKIVLDIKTPQITLPEIVAIVHNACKKDDCSRYGVQFYFGSNSYMRSSEVKNKILQIEQYLQ